MSGEYLDQATTSSFHIKKLRDLSPQANYPDWANAAVGEVEPTFAGRECYVVSATDSHGR
jgi:hypothetical protein